MLFIYVSLGIYFLAMLFVFAYALAQADLLWHFFKFNKEKPAHLSEESRSLPFVTVQLPVFNEMYVVERLLASVAKIHYPLDKLEIQILDDSTDRTQEIIQSKLKEYPGFPFVYIHRTDRKGFKAGALREGLARAKGEFIAIFDADFVPDPEFLYNTLGHFADPQVGLVQTRWTHLNEGYSVLTRLQAFALDAHFTVEQMGRNAQNAFINFNGTGGIWRKSCILDAGNWHDDTLTEDLDLSYRAQEKGWRFVYRPDIESPAELPPVMPAIKSQQFRWTKGGAECAVKHLGEVLRKPYSLRKKLHAMAHLLNSAIFVAILTAAISSIPIWYGFYKGLLDVQYFRAAAVFLLGFVVIAMVYFFANSSLSGHSPKRLLRFAWELPLFLSASMGLALHNSQAVWEAWTGKKSPFVRTPKYNLVGGDHALQKSAYHRFQVPISTYLELSFGILFLSIAILSAVSHTYPFLVFHLLLGLGFLMVGIQSLVGIRSMPR
ncbi:cellulose synthase family protein [Mariniradius sediminis]|uniref:Glycosyltransferase family 2 protein n=1 Tax=Mariniradius sediminis TaxID=2909237 RepID=A0ABS9BS34_9BACT|nr:cellulose synthase family protein [Mariniradius sediminis]MCF1750140.1 glycosyltransferase family 2 protein [Mariniradius sediminis]